MSHARLLLAAASLVALVAAATVALGAGDDTVADRAAPHATATAAAARAPAKGAVVTVRSSRYGRVLFDGRGRALYLFTHDRPRTSRCFGDCARAWPPFYTRGTPRARGDARPSLVGSIRRGKRRQVTYAGQPLYYYVGDREPGQILCQAVTEFGGVWYVVAPDGDAVTRR